MEVLEFYGILGIGAENPLVCDSSQNRLQDLDEISKVVIL